MESRLVLQYDEGQLSFRRVNPAASYQQLFALANAINLLQSDPVKHVLVVTVRDFGGV